MKDCAAIFAVALGLRLITIIAIGHSGFEFSNDSKAYHEIALELVEHHRFAKTTDPPFRLNLPEVNRPPLLPFLLAGAYSVGGETMGQVVLALAGSLAGLVACLLGSKLFSRAVGLTAGALTSIHPFFLLLSVSPLTESLAILFYPMIALLCTVIGQEPKLINGLVLGLLLGLASLNKPTILGFIPFLAVWFIVHFKTQRALGMKIFSLTVLSMVVVIAPWTIRNWIVFNQFVLISSTGWQNVYHGNSPYTEHSLALIESGAARGWNYHPEHVAVFAGSRSPVEIESKARTLAIAFIRENPGKFLEYALRKIRIFWMAYPHPIHRFFWYPVLLLSVLGFALTITTRQWKRLFPTYLLIAQTGFLPVFFNSLPRYRAPVEPLLMIFAAYAARELVKLLARGRPSPLREGGPECHRR